MFRTYFGISSLPGRCKDGGRNVVEGWVVRRGKVCATGGWNTGRGCEEMEMGVGPDSSFEMGTMRSFLPGI